MSRNDQIISQVKHWVKKIGKSEAMHRLAIRRVAPVTAEKICGGRYKSTPRDLLATILLEEMEKDGFGPPNVKAG